MRHRSFWSDHNSLVQHVGIHGVTDFICDTGDHSVLVTQAPKPSAHGVMMEVESEE